jgi:hypothetical protein
MAGFAAMTGRRRILFSMFGVYALLLAVALLAPSSGRQSHMASWISDLGRDVGVPDRFATQARAEFLANALIIMPVSALGSLIWPRLNWRDWTAIGFVVACGVELFQGIFLAHRVASTADIVSNTLGAFLGAVVVVVVERWASTRPTRSIKGR